MADPAGRGSGEPVTRPAAAEGDETAYNGWGSPVPAEYGSLRAARPPRPTSARTPRQASASGASVSALLKRLQGGGDGRARTTTGNGARNRTTQAGRTRTATARTGNSGQGLRSAPSEAAAVAAAVAVSDAANTTARTPTARSGSTGAARTSSPRPAAAPATPSTRRPPAQPAPTISKQQRRDAADLRAQRARSRATVRHIDIWTVVRVSLVFYLIAAIIIVGASMLLWYAADAFGTLPSIEKSIRTLFGLKSFKIHAGAVAGYMALAGLVLVLAGAIANVLAVLIYNLIADVVGGVRVELEAPRPRQSASKPPEV